MLAAGARRADIPACYGPWQTAYDRIALAEIVEIAVVRYVLVWEWGRIGSAGQTRIVSFPTQADAEAAFHLHRRRKERKGYR